MEASTNSITASVRWQSSLSQCRLFSEMITLVSTKLYAFYTLVASMIQRTKSLSSSEGSENETCKGFTSKNRIQEKTASIHPLTIMWSVCLVSFGSALEEGYKEVREPGQTGQN